MATYKETIDSFKERFKKVTKGIPSQNDIEKKHNVLTSNLPTGPDPLLIEVAKFISLLSPEMFDGPPARIAQEAIQKLEKLSSALLQVYHFDLLEGREVLLNKVHILDDQYMSTFGSFEPLTTQYSLKTKDSEKAEAANSIIIELEKKLADAHKMVEGIQSAGSKVGTSAFSNIFSEESTKYKESAKNWRYLIYLFSIVIIGAIIVLNYSFELISTEPKDIFNFVSLRLIVLLILLFLLRLSSKNYSAAKHNETISQHRANALSIFPVLPDAAFSDVTKDAILRSATEAIFSHQVTGFLIKEPEPSGLTKVTEIISSQATK